MRVVIALVLVLAALIATQGYLLWQLERVNARLERGRLELSVLGDELHTRGTATPKTDRNARTVHTQPSQSPQSSAAAAVGSQADHGRNDQFQLNRQILAAMSIKLDYLADWIDATDKKMEVIFSSIAQTAEQQRMVRELAGQRDDIKAQIEVIDSSLTEMKRILLQNIAGQTEADTPTAGGS